MPSVEHGALAAEDMARERGAEISSGGPVDGAEKARGRHRASLAGELTDDVVECAAPRGSGADPAVEPGHHEGCAVVERGGDAGAREVDPPPAIAGEEGDAAREARVREPSGAMGERERVVLGEALGDPVAVRTGPERLPDVEQLVEVGARLVGGAKRDVTVHEERVLAGEAPVPHRI